MGFLQNLIIKLPFLKINLYNNNIKFNFANTNSILNLKFYENSSCRNRICGPGYGYVFC